MSSPSAAAATPAAAAARRGGARRKGRWDFRPGDERVGVRVALRAFGIFLPEGGSFGCYGAPPLNPDTRGQERWEAHM